MSEGEKRKEAKFAKIDEGRASSRVANLLSGSSVRNRGTPCYLRAADTFVQNLAGELSLETLDLILEEIDQLSDSLGDSVGRACEIELVAKSLQQKSGDPRVSQVLLERLQKKRGISSVYEALQIASEGNLLFLLKLLSHQSHLSQAGVLIVATALCHCWHRSTSELYIFAQNLLKVLQQLLSQSSLEFLTPSLLRTIHVTLQTHKVFYSTQELKRLSLVVTEKLVQLPGHSSREGIESSMADRLSQPLGELLFDLGSGICQSPASLRSALRDVRKKMDESAMAQLLVVFSPQEEHLSVVCEVMQDYAGLDWGRVARELDLPDFRVRDVSHLKGLLTLYRAGAKQALPLSVMVEEEWTHGSGQLSLLENVLAVPPSVYAIAVDEEEAADAGTVSEGKLCPNPQGWAKAAVLKRLLQLSDVPSLARRVRDLFVRGLHGCPEVLLCALVRLQLKVAQQQPSEGMQMKSDLMKELIPLFFKPNSHHRVQNGQAALRRLWAISPNTVAAAFIEAWRSTANDTPQVRRATVVHVISISRLLPQPENATATILNWNKDHEFSVAVACVMADNDMLQLRPWLNERANAGGILFVVSVIAYLSKSYASASPRVSDPHPLLSMENLNSCLQFLQSLDKSMLRQTIPNALDKSSNNKSNNNSSGFTLGDSVKTLSEACLNAHPSIRNSLSRPSSANSSRSNTPTPSTSDDIEEMANSYFQKIYTSEQSIGEVVEMLKRFKTSGNSRENDIFACMIHNLFDEYRFFAKYPEKELRITGILFGMLIKEQLVSSITLGIALRYVLEALRKPPSRGETTSNTGKMFRFGMFALEQFKDRLHEWPQYCSHIVQIKHLKDGYEDLVSEIECARSRTSKPIPTEVRLNNNNNNNNNTNNTNNTNNSSTSSTSTSTSAPPTHNSLHTNQSSHNNNNSLGSAHANINSGQLNSVSVAGVTPAMDLSMAPPRVAVFGPGLGRAVNGEGSESQHEAPPDAILDRVQFLINNVTMNNVDQKAQELKDMLAAQFFGWLGHYLVVKRISCQPNFHSVYLAFLDQLGDYGKGLVEAILSSVYLNVGKLLRSPKITTSTQERSLLKNLGSWLGQITMARNRPILQIMLDCKELLFQGYETGMLIAVTPFVAKILEGAKKSVVFRPPNPWLMGLLSVFRALYGVDDLKMNIKFEVEVLCKNLGVKLEDIPLRTDDLAKRIPPVKARNPDFNMKSSMSTPPPPDTKALKPVRPIPSSNNSVTSNSGEQQQTVIPNLAAYVSINSSLVQLFQQGSGINNATLKRAVPIAVDRAIREIIQPVVERSVTIACITTKEIVTKDFAMESDENKMRKAAQLMVANLAGSLALVTCREPLRASVSTHLRTLLLNSNNNTTTNNTSNANNANANNNNNNNSNNSNNSNTNANANSSLSEQEQNAMEQCVAICATDNLELGCMLIEKAATEKAVRDMDEALATALNARKKHREQTGQPFYDMSIFNNNSRYPGALPDPLRPQPGGLRNDQLLVYEAFQRMPRQPSSVNNTPTEPKGIAVDNLTAITAKLDAAASALLTAAGPRAPEITLAKLPLDHEVQQILAAAQTMTSTARPLSTAETDSVLVFAQGVFKRLYELSLAEPLRLESLVAMLEAVNKCCPQLGQDLGTWATYAPTDTDAQRKLHRTVLLLLLRSHLVHLNELDEYLSRSMEGGHNVVWLEFTLLLVRTAVLERIAVPTDLPKVILTLRNVGDGLVQSPQILQTYRAPVLRLLEELSVETESNKISVTKQPTHQQSSSISAASLTNLAEATKRAAEAIASISNDDPPNLKAQVTYLLDGWMRIQSESNNNDKAIQFTQHLQQLGVGTDDDQTERFFRLSTELLMDAVTKAAKDTKQQQSRNKTLNYSVIDSYSKLVSLMICHMNTGNNAEQAATKRISLLNKVLGITVRTMMAHYERSKQATGGVVPNWDQRPWFRLLLNFVLDLCAPNPTLDPISYGILSVFASALHVVQPLVIPGFAFAWLELMSHRMFLSNLLLVKGQKGWALAHQLLIDLFLFLEPHLRKTELTDAMKHLYKGTLRVLLVLLHDYPAFLAGYHLSFCNVIPDNCVQLRNLVLSAFPRDMRLPDPFTPNLKIDLLPEIAKTPVILSDVSGPLASMRTDLDSYLKNRQPVDFCKDLIPRMQKSGSKEMDAPRVNALVLYVGVQAIHNRHSNALAHTPEMEILQKLMELGDRGRYIALNAIANQLRYPSSHTHYYSCVMLYLFSEATDEGIKEQITRVLLERLIVQRPHPWGLLITFIELIKNQRYQFWSHPFTRCATEIEKVFESVARSCMPPGSQRPTTTVGGAGTDISQ